MNKDEIIAILDSEQADVITIALRDFRIYLHEGGLTGIREERKVQFVDNLIEYFERLKQENYERLTKEL